MIWATFLLLPDNVREIFYAAQQLKECGVDSVSFRPVFHKLCGIWNEQNKVLLSRELSAALAISDPPNFRVFIPNRSLSEADNLRPADYFNRCFSRTLRTVMESTHKGIALQTCGMWRGSGLHDGRTLTADKSFSVVWRSTRTQAFPEFSPGDCEQCLDISFNLTINFILKILSNCPNAKFSRAYVGEQNDHP
jgi:hypothetical protein